MIQTDEIKQIKNIINCSSNICVFTGAGISCPSGIPDFRSANGLYSTQNNQQYAPEEIISHTFFETHCDAFYEFYKSKMIYSDALPNEAHAYFAALEKQGRHICVVTQNIDGLHQMAGSTNVIELHGSVRRNHCTRCGKSFDLDAIVHASGIPRCDLDQGIIKPDVVLYEEALDDEVIHRAVRAISSADTMFVIGTSLVVYPANTFIRYFHGNNLILINKSETQADSQADIVIHEDIIHVILQLS